MLVGDSRCKLGAETERFIDFESAGADSRVWCRSDLMMQSLPTSLDATSSEAYLQHPRQPPAIHRHGQQYDRYTSEATQDQSWSGQEVGTRIRSDQIISAFLWNAGERLNCSFSIILRFSVCALHTGFFSFRFPSSFPPHYICPFFVLENPQAGGGSWSSWIPSSGVGTA